MFVRKRAQAQTQALLTLVMARSIVVCPSPALAKFSLLAPTSRRVLCIILSSRPPLPLSLVVFHSTIAGSCVSDGSAVPVSDADSFKLETIQWDVAGLLLFLLNYELGLADIECSWQFMSSNQKELCSNFTILGAERSNLDQSNLFVGCNMAFPEFPLFHFYVNLN